MILISIFMIKDPDKWIVNNSNQLKSKEILKMTTAKNRIKL
jgi:hypothetical protein